MAPTTSNTYVKVIPFLDNHTFCHMVANANNPDSFMGATAYLIDALEYIDAPANMCSYDDAFHRFLAFAGQPSHAAVIPSSLHTALQERKQKTKAQIDKKKWLVFKLGLDWKSPQQMDRRDLFLDHLKAHYTIIAPHRKVPYPPTGHWIADTQSVGDKWHNHLAFGKLHDKRMPCLPIHILDREQLTKDVGPDQHAYIVDPNCKLYILICA